MNRQCPGIILFLAKTIHNYIERKAQFPRSSLGKTKFIISWLGKFGFDAVQLKRLAFKRRNDCTDKVLEAEPIPEIPRIQGTT